MRRFNSYGPINNKLYYYAPRKELIDRIKIGLSRFRYQIYGTIY